MLSNAHLSCLTGYHTVYCISRHRPPCQSPYTPFAPFLLSMWTKLQAVAVGAATHAASLSEGSQKLNSLETLEPFKKAMMQALARRRLLDDQARGSLALAKLLHPCNRCILQPA